MNISRIVKSLFLTALGVLVTSCSLQDHKIAEKLSTVKIGYHNEAHDNNSRQSPIDIIDNATGTTIFSKIEFNYPEEINVKVVNTGSPDEFAAIKAKVHKGEASIAYDGEKYNLLQFHWHTLSEHRLNGKAFPLEAHFVHQKEGATGLDDLLVVGVWYEVGESNTEIARIFAEAPADKEHYNEVEEVHIKDMLPETLSSYRYPGSLTTPPFTESVQWIVLSEPLTISENELKAYKEIFPHGNTRKPQSLNNRLIKTDVK